MRYVKVEIASLCHLFKNACSNPNRYPLQLIALTRVSSARVNCHCHPREPCRTARHRHLSQEI
jgi:hypothetical protein